MMHLTDRKNNQSFFFSYTGQWQDERTCLSKDAWFGFVKDKSSKDKASATEWNPRYQFIFSVADTQSSA